MKNIYSYLIKNTIEFMWLEYKLSINFSEYQSKKISNLLGYYELKSKENRRKQRDIKILLDNIKYSFSEETVNFVKMFVLFHEIGHFMLEKANYVQKEKFANFLAFITLKELISKRRFYENAKIFFKIIEKDEIYNITENDRKELIHISKLYLYKYRKYLQREKIKNEKLL